MFKKSIIALIIAALISFGSTAIASPGGEYHNTHCNGQGNINSPCDGGGTDYGNPSTATGYYYGNAPSYDESNSYSGYPGAFNDDAHSSAQGSSGGNVSTSASAKGTHPEIVGWYWWYPIYIEVPNEAYEEGGLEAQSNSNAWSYTNDYFSNTSCAGAGASFQGDAETYGLAIGPYGDREVVQGTVYVGGIVQQYHNANEAGYPSGSWVGGGNSSLAEFYASDYDYESGHGYVFDTNSIFGGAYTEGHTYVTGDFYGAYRSIEARTWNEAGTYASHPMEYSRVTGNGGVGGAIINGNTYAGGQSTFQYQGGTYGTGNAALNANIVNYGNSSHVTVSGSSSAYANPAVGNPEN